MEVTKSHCDSLPSPSINYNAAEVLEGQGAECGATPSLADGAESDGSGACGSGMCVVAHRKELHKRVQSRSGVHHDNNAMNRTASESVWLKHIERRIGSEQRDKHTPSRRKDGRRARKDGGGDVRTKASEGGGDQAASSGSPLLVSPPLQRPAQPSIQTEATTTPSLPPSCIHTSGHRQQQQSPTASEQEPVEEPQVPPSPLSPFQHTHSDPSGQPGGPPVEHRKPKHKRELSRGRKRHESVSTRARIDIYPIRSSSLFRPDGVQSMPGSDEHPVTTSPENRRLMHYAAKDDQYVAFVRRTLKEEGRLFTRRMQQKTTREGIGSLPLAAPGSQSEAHSARRKEDQQRQESEDIVGPPRMSRRDGGSSRSCSKSRSGASNDSTSQFPPPTHRKIEGEETAADSQEPPLTARREALPLITNNDHPCYRSQSVVTTQRTRIDTAMGPLPVAEPAPPEGPGPQISDTSVTTVKHTPRAMDTAVDRGGENEALQRARMRRGSSCSPVRQRHVVGEAAARAGVSPSHRRSLSPFAVGGVRSPPRGALAGDSMLQAHYFTFNHTILNGERVWLCRRKEVTEILHELHTKVAAPICRHFKLRYSFLSEHDCQAKKAGVTIKDPLIVKREGSDGEVYTEIRWLATIRIRIRKKEAPNDLISRPTQLAILFHELAHLKHMNHGPDFALLVRDIFKFATAKGIHPLGETNEIPSPWEWENAIFRTGGRLTDQQILSHFPPDQSPVSPRDKEGEDSCCVEKHTHLRTQPSSPTKAGFTVTDKQGEPQKAKDATATSIDRRSKSCIRVRERRVRPSAPAVQNTPSVVTAKAAAAAAAVAPVQEEPKQQDESAHPADAPAAVSRSPSRKLIPMRAGGVPSASLRNRDVSPAARARLQALNAEIKRLRDKQKELQEKRMARLQEKEQQAKEGEAAGVIDKTVTSAEINRAIRQLLLSKQRRSMGIPSPPPSSSSSHPQTVTAPPPPSPREPVPQPLCQEQQEGQQKTEVSQSMPASPAPPGSQKDSVEEKGQAGRSAQVPKTPAVAAQHLKEDLKARPSQRPSRPANRSDARTPARKRRPPPPIEVPRTPEGEVEKRDTSLEEEKKSSRETRGVDAGDAMDADKVLSSEDVEQLMRKFPDMQLQEPPTPTGGVVGDTDDKAKTDADDVNQATDVIVRRPRTVPLPMEGPFDSLFTEPLPILESPSNAAGGNSTTATGTNTSARPPTSPACAVKLNTSSPPRSPLREPPRRSLLNTKGTSKKWKRHQHLGHTHALIPSPPRPCVPPPPTAHTMVASVQFGQPSKWEGPPPCHGSMSMAFYGHLAMRGDFVAAAGSRIKAAKTKTEMPRDNVADVTALLRKEDADLVAEALRHEEKQEAAREAAAVEATAGRDKLRSPKEMHAVEASETEDDDNGGVAPARLVKRNKKARRPMHREAKSKIL
ncbi:unnamed protein product [Vitrella brassicaformis CCMP3155]|uniref:WLM domain-containing protein n=2 Tax=Vitrella brassicaformis TaxID=1169539 RepID=A0A0G4H4P9_VITBC|nr:unnamed protein product [Vitrella brassicaformis CCMP3155]|eukprot:CEM38523.1 unnamed protein product [Vitrella brassicaformis CCMP3155]